MMKDEQRTTEVTPRVSGLVLAGGQSRRMGRDKAFLEFEGKPLIERVIERVAKVCTRVIIVANDVDAYKQFGVQVIGDVYPGKGSLSGIYSGLQAAQEASALAVACDMPFLNEGLLRYLISLSSQYDVVIPRAADPSGKTPRSMRQFSNEPMSQNKGKTPRRADHPIAKDSDLHPMHAIYSKRCLAPMADRLRADDLRLISFHDAVRVRVVDAGEVDQFDPKHLSFFNVNTPEDLALASLAAQ